jgi:DNA-directed RNA polymerase specialized sigma24 family protein
MQQGADIEELFERYGPMVLRRCRQLLREEAEAQDVAQDVFVSVLRRRRELTFEYPSSLLFRIATNLSLNRIRIAGGRYPHRTTNAWSRSPVMRTATRRSHSPACSAVIRSPRARWPCSTTSTA